MERRDVQALVVCPTRELSAQVAREFRTLGRKLDGLVVATITGGEAFAGQSAALERGVHVLVGTPGRLLDHLKRGTLPTRRIVSVVLDEADRMLDMGFAADMEAILRELPKRRQTAFFSATFPEAIAEMSRTLQHDAVRVRVEDDAATIRQLALAAPEKRRALYQALAEHTTSSKTRIPQQIKPSSKVAQDRGGQYLPKTSRTFALEQRGRARQGDGR